MWNRWSREREIREAVEQRTIDLDNRQLATKAIYPRECAATLADELKYVAPDWRTARPTLGSAWGQLLKQQPELAPELTRRREAIITALFNNTPSEFHRAIQDLRKLIDLLLEAHEAAAYLVGWESGRLSAHGAQFDRVVSANAKDRRRRQQGGALRLHNGEV